MDILATKANLFLDAAKTSTATMGKDKGFINKNSQSTVAIKGSGTIVINSGVYAQYKCDQVSGVTTEISLQSITNTVQKELNTSDLIINRHKLNTQLFEFTNMKENLGTSIGNLTVNATVLVKAWEPTLEKFVLIRRPARFAVFGNLLDSYIVDDRLMFEENINQDIVDYKINLNDLSVPEEELPVEEEPEVPEEGQLEESVESETSEIPKQDDFINVDQYGNLTFNDITLNQNGTIDTPFGTM